MKLYYWSPFISNIATEKAVVNSIKSVKKFSKEKINPYLLDIIGEWDIQKKNLTNDNIKIIDLLNFKLLKYLPKYGFLRSRFSYIVVFFFSIFKLHKILRKDKPKYLMIHLMTFIPLLLLLFFNYETKFILRISGYPKLNYLRSFFWKIVGKKVYLISRHSLRKHEFDSDPGWLGPKYMGKFSGEEDYSKRRKWIKVSRNIGSVPPDLFIAIKNRIRTNRVQFLETEVQKCFQKEGQMYLSFQDNPDLPVDKVILATGFEKIRPGGNMLDRLIKKYQLPVADCGFPIVNGALAWHPKIHVSGSLAELEIGPIAKNISGARVAGERIIPNSNYNS